MQRTKQVWKEQEKLEIEEENRRIFKYLKEQEIRNEEAKTIASEKLKQSFALAEKMCAELEDIEVSFGVCCYRFYELRMRNIQSTFEHMRTSPCSSVR